MRTDLLGHFKSADIAKAKREIAEAYQADKDGFMPKEFEVFFIQAVHSDIDVLKRAVSSIQDKRWGLSSATNDILFSIEVMYQKYYNLNENDWGIMTDEVLPNELSKFVGILSGSYSMLYGSREAAVI